MTTIDITVHGLNGEVLLGPKALVREGLLQTLRTQLLDRCEGLEVQLVLDSSLVDSDAAFEGMKEALLTATFSEVPLDFKLWNEQDRLRFSVHDQFSVEKVENVQEGRGDLKKAILGGYTYSESEMSGSKCLISFVGAWQMEALASFPDKAKALFKLLEKQTSVTVEKAERQWNHDSDTIQTVRVPGYKLTKQSEVQCHM